jgi:hypothetical protein
VAFSSYGFQFCQNRSERRHLSFFFFSEICSAVIPTNEVMNEQSPDFASESPFCQEQMYRFSSALSTMDLSDFQPSVAAEVKQSDVETAEEAAISRLRQTQDGLDF